MAPTPKPDANQRVGTSDREIRARAAAARLAPVGPAAGQAALAGQTDLYEVIGVSEDCSAQELSAAYKRRVLQEHPDKGGDQARFDELQHAYSILADDASRDAYDAELAKARDRVRVEGRPTAKPKPAAEKAPVVKTAPHVGSKRSKDWLRCSAEHDADKSGASLVSTIRLAIVDAEGAPQQGPVAQKDQREIEREQTEALFQKYKGLNDGMKKQWVGTLSGKQKQALKARAKEEEGKQMDKAKKWLGKS